MFRVLRVITLSLLAFFSLFLIPAAQRPISAAQAADANKEVIRKLFDLFNKGDLNGLSAVIDANVVDHNAAPGQAPGIEGLKQGLARLRAAVPDAMYTIDDIVAQGDKVGDRLTTTGTNKGQFLGMAPTNKPVSFDSMDIYRIANGKVVEIWHIEDIAGLMQQLSAQSGQTSPATPGAPMAATQAMGAAQAGSGTFDGKALANNVYNAFNQDFQSGNFDNLDQLFAASYLEHSTNPGQSPDFAGLKQGLAQFRAAFPDGHFELEDIVAEGNTGIARYRFTGTNKGPLFPSAPVTNKKVDYEGLDYVKVANGKVTEHWSVSDNLTLFMQLGLLGGQPSATMAATQAGK
jgi:hypothetical protein